MNNRGKPLSHLELLKNRLIYLSTKLECSPHEKRRLRHVINEGWKTVYHNLGRNKLKPLDDDRFLHTHFALYFSDLDSKERNFVRYRRAKVYFDGSIEKRYYSHYILEEKFTTKGLTIDRGATKALTVNEIHDYVTSLQQSVELWYLILNPKDSTFYQEIKMWLKRLNRLGIHFVAPLILMAFQKESSSGLRIKLLIALESKLFLKLLFGFTGYGMHMGHDPHHLAIALKDGDLDVIKIVKTLEQEVDEYQNQPELFKNIRRDFSSQGLYVWKGLKYFFYEYEQHLRSKSKAHEDKLDWDEFIKESEDFATIEHIYPQKPRKPCWTDTFKDYSLRERNALRHSIGNLVPLSKAKNSSLQNKCFEDKVGKSDEPIGFRYGSYSENELTRYNDWTAHHILDRGIKLLTLMEKRWRISIGDRKDEDGFFGLRVYRREINTPQAPTHFHTQ